LLKPRIRIIFVWTCTAAAERDLDTGLLVGYVPGFLGAHSQAESLDELRENLREVIAMLLGDCEPKIKAEFLATQSIAISWLWLRCRFLNPPKFADCGKSWVPADLAMRETLGDPFLREDEQEHLKLALERDQEIESGRATALSHES
jgi:predicted RNase H-like HicB family nuclease